MFVSAHLHCCRCTRSDFGQRRDVEFGVEIHLSRVRRKARESCEGCAALGYLRRCLVVGKRSEGFGEQRALGGGNYGDTARERVVLNCIIQQRADVVP